MAIEETEIQHVNGTAHKRVRLIDPNNPTTDQAPEQQEQPTKIDNVNLAAESAEGEPRGRHGENAPAEAALASQNRSFSSGKTYTRLRQRKSVAAGRCSQNTLDLAWFGAASSGL